MKKIYTLILSLFFVVTSFSQTGKVFDNLTIKSSILKMERNYAVYLPPDYETSQRSYRFYIYYTEWVMIKQVGYNLGNCFV